MKYLTTLLAFLATATALIAQPIALHPENPHYLQYKGKPTVLITSAEHYGAVLNAAFDYKTYLRTLHEEGMNYTRIFTGSYVEVPGSFGIGNNTLSPAVGEFLAPWQRVDEAGLFESEGKFDLSEFNPVYFDRLRAFLAEAEQYDIIVEVTFFCATYTDMGWQRHPFNPGNNVNDLGELKRQDFNTLKNEKVAAYQRALVQKIVTEINDFDNFFFEISNEPWADNGQKVWYLFKTLKPNVENMQWAFWSESASPATMRWQEEMAKVVVETEKDLPKKHLIAQNYNNFKNALPSIEPEISILNFHYAWPEAVEMNYGWNLPINFDESGFAGSADSTYLKQAWEFMLAGGAIFNNLDYSFFVGAEDGTGENNAPGGGSITLRKQLKILRDFIESFDFIEMQPDRSVVHHAPGMNWQALVKHKQEYAICFSGNPAEWVKVDLPKGRYSYEWVDPETGEVVLSGNFRSKKEPVQISLPYNRQQSLFALRIERS